MIRSSESRHVGIVAVVLGEKYQAELLSRAYTLARSREESLTILVLTETGARPAWLSIPSELDEAHCRIEIPAAGTSRHQMVRWMRSNRPKLMAFAFDPNDADDRHLLSRELDTLLLQIKCPVALFHPGEDYRPVQDRVLRTLIPYTRDANSLFAVSTALELNPRAEVTVAAIGAAVKDDAERVVREQEIRQSLGKLADDPRVRLEYYLADDAVERLAETISGYEQVIFGLAKGHTFLRAMLGERVTLDVSPASRRIVAETGVSYVLVREHQGLLRSGFSLAVAHGGTLLPEVTRDERIEIYKEVRRGARPRTDFFVMIALSAAIAAFGLILNSAAVIIGAMLIAPLMAAIIGMGLAMVQGDSRFLVTSASAMGKGALTAIGVGVLIGFFNVQDAVTHEMLSRTGPALLDLGVATLSGAAAAYALCRRDMSASLPGVAIAVALVPPLATVGLFVSLGDWGHAYGALLLFLTNLAAIAFASGIIFTLVGFRPPSAAYENTSRLLAFRRGFLAIGLLTLVVLTQLTVRSIDDFTQERLERRITNAVQNYVKGMAAGETHLIDLDIVSNTSESLHLIITAASNREIDDVDFSRVMETLSRAAGKPVKLSLILAPLSSEYHSRVDR